MLFSRYKEKEDIIKIIAKQEGISVAEIRKEMELAVENAYKTDNPEIKTEFIIEMLECFHRLPKEALPACIWAYKNSEQVFSMIETEPYSTEKIDKLIQDSL